ncbi:MAG: hypothetical protein II248_00965 [Paludibacteraceae bacterium]|nr:hypothetical protein [Paludibacteraceae bacterium]
MKTKVIIIITLVICCSCSKKTTIENDELQEAISQVWLDADVAHEMLEKIDISTINYYEQQRYRLAEAHLMLKRELKLPSESDMDALAKYFESCEDEASVAEAYYIQGAYLNWLGKNTQAMQYLKKAESNSATAIIRGMTYYKMGRISESEQLYDIALKNYQKALPYLEEAGLPLYLASVYRELGRNSQNIDRDTYFNKALSAAQFIGDSILQKEIRYAQLTASQSNSPELAHICQYMCHIAGQQRYAYDLVKYYIRNQKADSARVYLDILAADTTAQVWSKQQYKLWHSQYLHLTDSNKNAYEILFNLYNEDYTKEVGQNRASAFVAAQHYDNEVEHAKNVQLQLDKQRLYIILTSALAGVLCIVILAILFISRQRAKHLVEKTRNEEEILNLQNELQLRRESLKRIMSQRIELSKNLQEAVLSRKKDESIPQWAKDFIDQNIFSTEVQWNGFLKEFEEAYGDILTRLQHTYPRLTSTDLQVIALYILGIDNSDICQLTGATQRTIWSRRMRIKNRIGLGDKESLDKWIERELRVES